MIDSLAKWSLGGTVAAAVQDLGTVVATSGRLVLGGSVTGTGDILIASGATLEVDGTVKSGLGVRRSKPAADSKCDSPGLPG
jgi:hypothetical protein